MKKHDLIIEVVDQDICIGCGVCAGVCPKNRIEMRWSPAGELNPYIEKGCDRETCIQVCIKCCPILNAEVVHPSNFESSSKHSSHPLVGDYQTCYVGYIKNEAQRNVSSSGGLLTWILEEMLETNAIQGVITVVNSDMPEDGLFKFEILRSPEDLHRAAGSKYYPVEISDIIRFLKKDKSGDVYGLVGLPCLLQGVSNAKGMPRRLSRKIKYTFSLTCGQLPNRGYTNALAAFSGILPKSLSNVNYRCKDNTETASNYRFEAKNEVGVAGKQLLWVEQPSLLWENSFFTHGACKFCDDVFGRTADVIFMDAWLPQYISDPKGHSIIIVKNNKLNELIKAGSAVGSCVVDPIELDDVLKSQKAQIIKKTELLAAHLYMAKKKGIRITKRHIQPSRKSYRRWKADIELQWKVMKQSKSIWIKLTRENRESEFFDNIVILEKEINKRKRFIYLKQGLRKVLNSPLKTCGRVWRQKKIYLRKQRNE